MRAGDWIPENYYFSNPWQPEVDRLNRIISLVNMEIDEFRRYNRELIKTNARLKRQIAILRGYRQVSTTKRGGYKLGTRTLRGK